MTRPSPNLVKVACLLVMCGLWAGCRPTVKEVETVVAPPVETLAAATFAEQLQQVKAGDSQRIEVHDVLLGDEDLAALRGVSGLEILILQNTNITDAGLALLADLPKLVDLRLPRAAVTDEGLRQLSNMPQLERLRLGSPHVTDVGLVHIATLAKLRSLILVDTPITDAGLEHVRGLANLESLYLQRTQVTDDGVDRLQAHRAEQGLPTLHVHW